MSVAGESGRAQQMRARARDLEQAAERATDPQERQRLKVRAGDLDAVAVQAATGVGRCRRGERSDQRAGR
ncbi:DUF6381 family protein, partial [Streptomyces sp. NPDC005373]|uniref:DUF6381 family protein n=1 Tax=Streptomyces sp. NPDC005373 TaxID=3156879 RepID=UPI0033ADD1AC